ncbi:MAG TPA: DNA internalization-related competence protein ComEC/Rec2 [Pyrinomonadaceae bacterium]|nr:DNA internalization-related competence protein ComEC/Rec2 [Pyrinomonadaceae bacterium]
MNQKKRRANVFPLAQLGAAFCGGILLSETRLSFGLVLAGALLGTLVCTLLLILDRIRAAAVSLLLAFVFCGGTLGLLETRAIEPDRVKRLFQDHVITPGEPVEVTGVLQRNVEISWDALHVTINVERISAAGCERPATGVVALTAPISTDTHRLERLHLRHGARIRLMTILERADKFRNPGVSPFTEYLDRKGYDASASIKSLHLIERLDDDVVFLPLAWIYDWRNQLQEQIDARLSRDTAGVLDAALLGNRYNLSTSVEERFRTGGTFHVLVISGLHITLLGGVVYIVIRRFTKNRSVQFMVSTAIVWGYSIGVGAEPSILRAALMFTVIMFAPLMARRASPLNALGAVAIALVLWKPSSLFDPSFQLTFVSVLAILVVAWPILHTLSAIGSWQPSRASPYPPECASWIRRFAETLYWNEAAAVQRLRSASYEYRWFKNGTAETLQKIHGQRLVRFVFAALLVSISVQITLLPFLIIYFHRFSLASFVLNIFVGVAMAGVAVAALVGVLVSQVSPMLSEPFFLGANSLNWLMVHSVDPFTSAQVASIRVPEHSGPLFSLYVLYYVPLATLSFVLMRWRPLEPATRAKRSRWLFWVSLCAQLVGIAVLILHPYSHHHAHGKLRVDFLDVGQGDAALITLPDNTTVLVDGGGRPGPFNQNDDDESVRARSVGETVVSEYLWWRGLDRIDYLVATHADADHMDGLNDVAANFRVRAAFVARFPERDQELDKLMKSLTTNAVPLRMIGAGDELRIGNISLQVLWPKPSVDARAASGNNDSVVIRAEYGNRSILLTGDIEARTERMLVAEHQRMSADVIKVAHHGSRTSSTEEFVRSTGSRLAVVSVGEPSVFGHPHHEVVKRWQENGAQILRTGNRGMITVVTDGQSMHYTTFVNP